MATLSVSITLDGAPDNFGPPTWVGRPRQPGEPLALTARVSNVFHPDRSTRDNVEELLNTAVREFLHNLDQGE